LRLLTIFIHFKCLRQLLPPQIIKLKTKEAHSRTDNNKIILLFKKTNFLF
jgi:hypothetical protein